MRHLIDWCVFLVGLFFIGTLLHEFYHWLHCGGDFVAGFYLRNGEPIIGMTWCASGTPSGELVPTLAELFFYIIFILIKHK